MSRLLDAGRVNDSRAEEGGRFFRNALLRHFVIVAVNFKSNAVSSPLRGCHRGRAGAHKGIENRVTNETEHTDEPFGKLKGIRCRMLLCGCSRDSSPYLLEPLFVILCRNHT